MRLRMVTGAPGAGKTTALNAFLALGSEHVAFDVDWLGEPASELAGRSVYHDASTWPAYSRVWFEVLHAIHKNGLTPVLFSPLTADDIAASGRPGWYDGIDWILLDCADHVRTARLGHRGWTAQAVDEALADAAALRATTPTRIDTGLHPPGDVAARLAAWLS